MEDVIYGRCAGIDVHKKIIMVCLRIGRKTQTREFGTLTHELREMTAWLKENGCQMAAMESTGSYVSERRHGRMNASPEQLFLSLEGIITPIQHELFKHVMKTSFDNVQQTAL